MNLKIYYLVGMEMKHWTTKFYVAYMTLDEFTLTERVFWVEYWKNIQSCSTKTCIEFKRYALFLDYDHSNALKPSHLMTVSMLCKNLTLLLDLLLLLTLYHNL